MNLEIDYLWSHKCPKKWNQYTLVALVITIIILLILAGITIASLRSSGLFSAAQDAKTKTEEKTEEENTILEEYEDAITEQVTGKKPLKPLETNKKYESKAELKDANGNKIVVPAGFKIVSDATTNNATTVDQGIVIEDATGTATNGSQFVWIPVGDIKKADGTTTSIALNRYSFDSNGVATEFTSTNFFEEDKTNTTSLKNYGNTISENINAFKTSVATNGGFYIGRYEARKNSSEKLTTVKTDKVWYDVAQRYAATNSKNMYTTGVTSELMNSYAWDTATLFLQTFGENNKYSRQNSLNTGILALNGTDNDKQCNVYDMASNVGEVTTETYCISGVPCTFRGGNYGNPSDCTSNRYNERADCISRYFGFRPLLYL